MTKCVTINWYDRHLYFNFERNRGIQVKTQVTRRILYGHLILNGHEIVL